MNFTREKNIKQKKKREECSVKENEKSTRHRICTEGTNTDVVMRKKDKME